MDLVYYVSAALVVPTFLCLIVALILFLVKPHLLQKSKRINKPVSRIAIFGIGIAVLFVAFVGYGSVLAATEPASIKQERLTHEAAAAKTQQEEKNAKAAETQKVQQAPKPVVKIEIQTASVPFDLTEVQDGALAQGQTRVTTEGVNGERTIAYEVTYEQDKQTARKEIKNEITKTPIAQVTQVGTYIAPPPQTPVPASHIRTGAICKDGSPSSATGSGACSHHGGVAYWLYG